MAPIVREVGQYLAGTDATDAERGEAACNAFRNARADFDQFAASALRGEDVIAVELAIRGGGRDLLSVYSHLPSPLSLLLVCARNCEDGDLVGVRQRTAKCGTMHQEARWPFGVADAEMLTRPANALFAALNETDACQVRRHERTVRVFGRVASEREERDQRVWCPRLGRWREPDRGIRGITVRFGRLTRRIGRVRPAA